MFKFIKKITILSFVLSVSLIFNSQAAFAHIVVKPSEVLVGSFQTFNVSVPNERQLAVTSIKLDIPITLSYVTPSVKPGWDVEVNKEGSGEQAKIKSISWTKGSIATGFRDDFTFSAKVPDSPSDLEWKAFQTYSDGVVVSWNLKEKDQPKKADGKPDFSKSGPLSVTRVLSEDPATALAKNSKISSDEAKDTAQQAIYVGIAGLSIAIIALLGIALKLKNSNHKS